MSYELFIAKRYLKSKRKQKFISLITIISIGGVFVGVMALIIVLAIMNGFEEDLRGKILGINAHILIQPGEGKGIRNYSQLVSEIRELPDVIEASPHLEGKAMISLHGYADGIKVRGIDPEKELSVTKLSDYITRGAFRFDSPELSYPGIVLGKDLADNIGATVDDIVILAAPSTSLITGAVMTPRLSKFQVSGIFRTNYFEFDTTVGYISLEEAQQFFRLKNRINGIEVKLHDIYAAPEITAKLQETFDKRDIKIRHWMELNKNLFSALKLEKSAMFVILTLAIIVSAFNIIGTLIMVVIEKKKEIGILKALGANSRSIMFIFMVEGVLIGIFGTSLGLIFGVGICYFLDNIKFLWLANQFDKLPASLEPVWGPLQGGLQTISQIMDKVPIQMEILDLTLIAIAAMVITVSATIYPAFQASKMDPVKAIKEI